MDPFFPKMCTDFSPACKSIAEGNKYHAMVLNHILFSHNLQYSPNHKHPVGGKNEKSARSTVCVACA